jgi:hypothetical protein
MSKLSTALHKFVVFFNAEERGGKRKVTQSFLRGFATKKAKFCTKSNSR